MQRLYWRHLSKPAAYRELFMHAIDASLGSILEIGMGSGERLRTILTLYHLPPDVKQLRYAALDPFESGGGEHLTLKAAHRLLSEHGVKAHLIPGEPAAGVVRVAHTVLPSDLVIIDGHWDNGTEDAAVIAKWLPRLCHSRSKIFACRRPGERLETISVPLVAGDSVGRSQAA
jgi:hypothetical protein